MNFEFEREIGFINSQPSLAECLTSFPAVLESFQTSSIKESTVIPPPFEHTIPSLSPCTGSQPRPPARNQQLNRRTSASNGLQSQQHRGAQQPQPQCPAGQAPATPAEFPWMKEKKSSKKCSKPGNSSSSGSSGGGSSGAGAIIPPTSCSPSPTASGYAAAAIDSPTGQYHTRRKDFHLGQHPFISITLCSDASISPSALCCSAFRNHHFSISTHNPPLSFIIHPSSHGFINKSFINNHL